MPPVEDGSLKASGMTWLGIWLWFGAPAAGAATLGLQSQLREVRIEVERSEDFFSSCAPLIDPLCTPDSSTTTPFSNQVLAPDASPWLATASLAEFPGTFANQDSEITASSIRASGSHGASSSYSNTGGFPITFMSESHSTETSVAVSFELASDAAYTLEGRVTAEGSIFASSSTFIRLSGPGGVIAEVQVDSDIDCTDPSCFSVGPLPIVASGVLTAGPYVLTAFAGGNADGIHSTSGSFGSGIGGTFDVELIVTDEIPMLPPPVPMLPRPALLGLALALLALSRLSADRQESRT